MSKRVAFRTLGCRLNLYETDALADTFHKAGYEIADFNEVADIYIINTCTVTNQSDRKSRQVINQALKRTEGGFVVVTGCMVNNHKESLLKAGKAHLFIDNEHKARCFPLWMHIPRRRVINPDSLPGRSLRLWRSPAYLPYPQHHQGSWMVVIISALSASFIHPSRTCDQPSFSGYSG
jgi:threonylcarbamoyladenosine tRNA methylthiotransferase MtaB